MRRQPPASALPCCRRPAHAKSNRFGNEDRFDSNPHSRATGRTSPPATASAEPTAHAVHFHNLSKIDRSSPPWLAFSLCLRLQAVLRYVLVLPFQPLTLFAVGFFPLVARWLRCRPIWLILASSICISVSSNDDSLRFARGTSG